MLNNKSKIVGIIRQGAVIWLAAVLTFIFHTASGQHYQVQEFDTHLKHGVSLSDSVYHIIVDTVATGLVLKIDVNEVFDGAYLVVGNDTIYLSQDEDGDVSQLYNFSNLLTFSPPIGDFLFSPGRIRSQITFYFINAQTSMQDSSCNKIKKKSDGCSEPGMIDQSFGEKVGGS
jgi:hypothetical protein